tara:strand:- start:33 stop:332 length:300 start_codon:yes stop_codon:yes gene_type:complete
MERTIYKRITSATTTTLITKGSGVSGSIKKILLTNSDDTDPCVVNLDLYTGSTTAATIAEINMPPRTTVILDDNLAFDSSIYNLRITTSTTAEITVIIK